MPGSRNTKKLDHLPDYWVARVKSKEARAEVAHWARFFTPSKQPCRICGVHPRSTTRSEVCTVCWSLKYQAEKEAHRRNRNHRTCEGCGAAFQPPRSDSYYCCNACRQHAYRERKTTGDPSTVLVKEQERRAEERARHRRTRLPGWWRGTRREWNALVKEGMELARRKAEPVEWGLLILRVAPTTVRNPRIARDRIDRYRAELTDRRWPCADVDTLMKYRTRAEHARRVVS